MEECKQTDIGSSSASGTSQMSKNQQRVQRRRQLVLQQLIDRPPVATDWTTLPNVLLTHIAQEYLHEERWDNNRRHANEVIPFALSCRDICRVLSHTYRWRKPVDYYFGCSLTQCRMYVTDAPEMNCDPSQYLASWPMPSGLPRKYLAPHPSIAGRYLLSDEPPQQLQENSSSSSSNILEQPEPQQSASSTSCLSAPTAPVAGIDSDDENEGELHSMSPIFLPGVIGRRTLKQIVFYRHWTGDALNEHRMKHGQIVSTQESRLQPLDFSWLPKECEQLLIDQSIYLPPVPMSEFDRLHTITLDMMTSAYLTRPPSLWPPQLQTLNVLSCYYRSWQQEQEDDDAGIQWNRDPAHNVAPESISFPPTLTELNLSFSVFSSDRYRLGADLIPWPSGLKKLSYCGPSSARGWKLPESLTYLKVTSFPSGLRGWIVPKNMKTILFPHQYKGSLEEITWPSESLTELDLGYEFNHSLKDARLPESLLELSLRGQDFAQPPSEIVFPSRLTSLTLEWNYRAPLAENEKLILPDSITRLHLDQFNVPLEKIHLPASLAHLKLPSIFNHPIEGVLLPAGLRELSLGDAFNYPIEKWIPPPILESLHVGATFNQPVVGLRLPESLKQINLGPSWNQAIRGWQFPTNLIRLDLGGFNQPMKGVRLPSRLSELVLPARFSQIEALMKVVLPKTLRSVTLPSPEKFPSSPSYARYRGYVEKLKKEIFVTLHPAIMKK